jgi:gamma-glutamyltranspeptidase / glutathione hydrolase
LPNGFGAMVSRRFRKQLASTADQASVSSMKNLIVAFLALILLPVPAVAAGGVVSSADIRASEAGREILRAGGSASDAAMAMMLALTVVEPQSSGIGGGGFLVYHDGKSGKIATIDGRETAPRSLRPNRFLGPDGKPMAFSDVVTGGKSVGVPGNIALMATAHKKWGKLKWAQLFTPAIRLAEEGYVISPRLAATLAQMKSRWTGFDATQALYWKDGQPKRAGERMKNPALASVLRAIAADGPKAFYAGDNAEAIQTATTGAARNPATVSLDDLARYRAVERPAVCATYRVYKICGMGPPSSGAVSVLQILGMLERFDLKALGKDNPKSWHLIAEAMYLAYADREKWLGDSDFVTVPLAGLLDKAYIAKRSALISPDTSLPSYEAGTPAQAAPRTAAISGEVSGTSHFIAVDGKGSVASMTSTVEGPFGSQLIANGYFLNNELTDFSFAPEKNGAPVANRAQPGKRPLSSMAPTIVYGLDGKPIFTVGAAGGKRIIMQVAKTLIAHLDWGLSAQDAIAAPNIFFGGEAILLEAGTWLAAMAQPIAVLGRTVVTSPLGPAKANAAARTASGWHGAADPRSEGAALDE